MPPTVGEGAIVVMGVSGCGKTSVAEALVPALGWTMIEGDAFHSEENRARMRAGVPLTDENRQGWLETLGRELQRHPQGAVLSCSALKRKYRDTLRAARPGLRFAFLDITPALAQQRVSQRAGHFFNPNLVADQFATLESPVGEPGVLRLDAALPIAELRDAVLEWLTSAATNEQHL